ncbi:MAG: hypothetical protein ACI9N0_002347 [Ilumatobacter sp.]|jgi:hypothetical protein
MTETAEHNRIRKVATILHDVAKPMRVLSALSWPAEVREQFLTGGGTRLPAPVYVPIDPDPVIDGARGACCAAAASSTTG